MKRIIVLLLLLMSCNILFAQEVITVKGVVRDETNLPIPGATVNEKGTTNTTITGNDGTFQIKVKSDGRLVFSYLGTKSSEQAVNGRTSINAKLIDDAPLKVKNWLKFPFRMLVRLCRVVWLVFR
jgi:hypothetical protein